MNFYSRFFSILFLLSTIINVADSQTVYTWNGSVSSSFSAAGNWTPFRQIGLVTDILIFDRSGNINATNVYQVTVGQLIVKNNTQLTLSPASGNAKLITIKGTALGEDLVIESGSSLRILGNDPSLNIYVGTGATATIKGSFTFEGSIGHYLNAADPMAIRFKSGSVLSQLCPGSIFNTTGINNAVVFESGSLFRINHTNALNPFGVSAPNSKVMFENSSNLIISNIGSLQLAGRTIANLTVDQGTNLNISESFTSDINVADIIVNNGASLTIKNTNTNYTPSFNIHGNITVNGTFKFSDDITSKFNVKFTGTSLQDISGSGVIMIPSNLNKFELLNSISLHKDLTVNCPIVIHRFEIMRNGFEFNFNPIFGNPFHGSRESTGFAGNNEGNNEILGKDVNSNLPSEYSISHNYPNPFNPSTKIDFALPTDTKVSINVYDITGKLAVTLLNSDMSAGNHSISFNASHLSSGVYFYTINAGNFTKTQKMILTK